MMTERQLKPPIRFKRKATRLDRASYPCYGFDLWVEDNLKAHISVGNSKLKDIIIWNLPAIDTCPGATEACKSYCYATKGHSKLHAGVAGNRNWEFSKKDYFVDAMIAFIDSRKEGYVRIHEAGDFYSAEYLDDWLAIARDCDDKVFYAYTRSHDLFPTDMEIPDNLILRYSVDPATEHYPALPMAISYTGEGFAPSSTFVCPSEEQGKHVVNCKGPCTYCMQPNGDVLFLFKKKVNRNRTDIISPYRKKRQLVVIS